MCRFFCGAGWGGFYCVGVDYCPTTDPGAREGGPYPALQSGTVTVRLNAPENISIFIYNDEFDPH